MNSLGLDGSSITKHISNVADENDISTQMMIKTKCMEMLVVEEPPTASALSFVKGSSAPSRLSRPGSRRFYYIASCRAGFCIASCSGVFY